MVPLAIFTMLAAGVFLLMIYSFIDHQNRIYANIITAFLCALLAAYLGSLAWTGTVYESTCCLHNASYEYTVPYYDEYNQTWANYTETGYNTSCAWEHPFESPSLGWVFFFISFCMFIYTLYMGWDAWDEHQRNAASELREWKGL